MRTEGKQMTKARIKEILIYIILIVIGFGMVYPLIWMFFACFKTNNDMFSSIGLLPKKPVWTAFKAGWESIGQYTYTTFFKNTFTITIPTVIFTILSSLLTAFGLARFHFRLKKVFISVVVATIMLPASILIVPRYILFDKFDWLNTYLPFIVPSIFATNSFYIFLLIQFLRGIPKELDEAAIIDGCGYPMILIRIIIPLCKPALFTVGLFQFMNIWNDFYNSLVYINSVSKYPLSLALRLTMDNESYVAWNEIMAMSLLSIVVPVLLFFFAQKYFVEGISTTGLKG